MYYALKFRNSQTGKIKNVFTQVNDIGIFTFDQLIVNRKVPGKVNMVIKQEEKNGYKLIFWDVVNDLPKPFAIHLEYTVHKSEKKKLRAKVKHVVLNDLHANSSELSVFANYSRLADNLSGILNDRYSDPKSLDGDYVMQRNKLAALLPLDNIMNIVRTSSMLMAMQLELTKDELKLRKEDFDAMISDINYGMLFKDPMRAVITEHWLYDENGQQYRILTNFYCSWNSVEED